MYYQDGDDDMNKDGENKDWTPPVAEPTDEGHIHSVTKADLGMDDEGADETKEPVSGDEATDTDEEEEEQA